MDPVAKVLQEVLNFASVDLGPWVYAWGLLVTVLVFIFLPRGNDSSITLVAKSESDETSPEFLNFKVNQHSIDRLRNPSLPLVGKKFADQTEREHWLQDAVSSGTQHLFHSEPWDHVPECDGFIHEYIGSRHDDEQGLKEFASLGFEIRALESVNLPKFRGLGIHSYLERIERIWSPLPACGLAVKRMNASRAQMIRFTETLLKLHRLGLKVETIRVWALLQQDGGDFFIPHLPQVKEEAFPCNLQRKLTNPVEEFPAHLFGPGDRGKTCPQAFQFQLASLYWRLLARAWPYDREPLLLTRSETPQRIAHDFGERLTPVLTRMTALGAKERYEDLGVALAELASALASLEHE